MMRLVTMSDRKKEEIMEMLENKNTQKKRTPRAAMIALAAALAVGCVLSIAAGLPSQVYNFMSGGSVTIQMSPELVEKLNDNPSYELNTVNYPWFQAALDQLDQDW